MGNGEIGCRRQARRALRTGFRLGERYSSERMRANQIARKFDEIVEFFGCARYIDTPVTQGAWQLLGRLPQAA